MSIHINGADFRDIIDVASIVGSIVATTLVVWIVYMMVRPSRRVREQRRRDREERPGELEEMWRLMDRMDSRLEVLERAVSAEERTPIARRPRREHEDRLLSPADGGRDPGGKE
ncbi:MAG TPA: hypothetical protein VEW04_10290 [Allosphingosinicella sp.]|nr:hypothetical protein [Allosphingosinicella sp.]